MNRRVTSWYEFTLQEEIESIKGLEAKLTAAGSNWKAKRNNIEQKNRSIRSNRGVLR
jgi:FtsZ-binding cell division protein ZapB